MAKIDYYIVMVYKPYKLSGEEIWGTLREAKQAYIKHLQQGHRGGRNIYGCSRKDTSAFLSVTPWYSDVKVFGRTELTNIGHAVKIGKYELS